MPKQSHKSKRAGSAEEAVFVELIRTADLLSRSPSRLLKSKDLSSTQYNVLRILRGAPEGLTCGEIGERMITRDPDVTRLLDRMEKRELVSRCRDTEDRRAVKTRITLTGLKTLAELDGPVLAVHRQQLGHLGQERLLALGELLGEARQQVL